MIIAIVVVMLTAAVGYEAYMRRQDLRIYRGLLAQESAERIATDRRIDAATAGLIEQLQKHAVSLERNIAAAQTAVAAVFIKH